MEKFWNIEEITTNKTLTKEQYCEEQFKIHTTRDDKGCFVVRLSQKEKHLKLGTSYNIALKRFKVLEQKLSANPELITDYVNFMREYEALDHMQQAPNIPSEGQRFYYMPHHAVLKQQSTTTRTRVVFDASCQSDNGVSLNATLCVGPTVQQDLLSIVTRFLTHQVALTADVAKVYRQMKEILICNGFSGEKILQTL